MVGDPYHAILEEGGGLLEVLALLYYFERDAPAHRQVIKREYDAFGDAATAATRAPASSWSPSSSCSFPVRISEERTAREESEASCTLACAL